MVRLLIHESKLFETSPLQFWKYKLQGVDPVNCTSNTSSATSVTSQHDTCFDESDVTSVDRKPTKWVHDPNIVVTFDAFLDKDLLAFLKEQRFHEVINII